MCSGKGSCVSHVGERETYALRSTQVASTMAAGFTGSCMRMLRTSKCCWGTVKRGQLCLPAGAARAAVAVRRRTKVWMSVENMVAAVESR